MRDGDMRGGDIRGGDLRGPDESLRGELRKGELYLRSRGASLIGVLYAGLLRRPAYDLARSGDE